MFRTPSYEGPGYVIKLKILLDPKYTKVPKALEGMVLSLLMYALGNFHFDSFLTEAFA